MFGLGMQEMLIIGVIAILLFGKRLPEVAKSFGKTYGQFRKGLSDLQGEFNVASYINDAPSTPSRGVARPRSYDIEDREEATAPKFELPPSEPTAQG